MEDKSAFVASHPAKALLGFPKGAGRDMERAYNSFRFVCAVARDLGSEYGVQKKSSGDFLPIVNGQGYWGDGLRTRTSGVDIVNDREGEGASPTWNNPKDDATLESFALPPSDADIVKAMGGTPEPPPVTPPPTEPPPVPPSGDLGAKLAALELRVTHLETRKLVLAVREE